MRLSFFDFINIFRRTLVSMLSISRSDSSLLATALHLNIPFHIAAKSNFSILENDKPTPVSLPQTLAKHLAQTSKPDLLGKSTLEYAQIHDCISTCNETSLVQLEEELETKTFMVGTGFTLADLWYYAHIYQLRGTVLSGSLPNLVRYFDLVQAIVLKDLEQDYFKKIKINLEVAMV